MTNRSTEADIDPKLLIWARESSRMSLEVAAEKLAIEKSKLSEWETGKLRISVAELRRCAKTYKRPIAAFFLPYIPPLPKDLKSYRAPGGDGSPEDVYRTEFEIRAALRRREVAIELSTLIGAPPPRFDVKSELSADPARVANIARNKIGVSVEEQVSWKSYHVAIKRWVQSVEAMGVMVFQFSRVSSEYVAGLSINRSVLPVILLNGADNPARRAFTLFHELAHLIIKADGACDLTDPRRQSMENRRVELFCNRFSAAFLVPSNVTDALHLLKSEDQETAIQTLSDLALRFRVSKEVILRRLRDLRFVSESDFYELLQILAERAAAEAERGNKDSKGNYYATQLRNVGYKFSEVVLTAFDSGIISDYEASTQLEVKTRNLSRFREEFLRGT